MISNAPEDLSRLDAFIVRHLKAGTLRGVYVKDAPPDAGSSPRLVMHREKDAYIRARNRGDADALLDAIEQNWERVMSPQVAVVASGEAEPTSHSTSLPLIQTTMSIRFNEVNRALAKIAFNFLAWKGVVDVFSEPFDDIRAYVLGDVRKDEVSHEGGISMDSRFVVSIHDRNVTPPLSTSGHALTLVHLKPQRTLCAWITLYGHNHFLVRLAEIDLTEELCEVHEFSVTRSGNKGIDMIEVLRRAKQPTG